MPGYSTFFTYIETGLVPRFPTAFLSASLILLGVVLLTCGIILDTVTKGRIETKRMAYLAIPAINSDHQNKNPISITG